MMPVRQKNEKNHQGSRQTFWRIERTGPQPWRRNGTPTKPDSRLPAHLAGTMRAQGNHGLKSPRRLGAANGLPVKVLVRRYRTPLAEPTGPRFIPHLRGGVVMEGKGKRP
jgi:hypothetical protein